MIILPPDRTVVIIQSICFTCLKRMTTSIIIPLTFACMILLLSTQTFVSASNCENINKTSIVDMVIGGEHIVSGSFFTKQYDPESGNWNDVVIGKQLISSLFLADNYVLYRAIPETNFVQQTLTNRQAYDDDKSIIGQVGPLAPTDTYGGLMIPIFSDELCMWSTSGAGPTGHSLVCADNDDREILNIYVDECAEDGSIIQITSEGYESNNSAKKSAEALEEEGSGILSINAAFVYSTTARKPGY